MLWVLGGLWLTYRFSANHSPTKVLANALSPWATSFPLKPIRLSAILAVWLLVWVRGFLSAGNICSRVPLIGFMTSSRAIAGGDKGMVCGRFIYKRLAGIFQTPFFESTSSQRAPAASLGRVIVCSCHSSRHRVVLLMLAFAKVLIKSGSWAGFSVGMWFLAGASKGWLIPAIGFVFTRPVFTAYVMISLRRWQSRFTVSREPLLEMGVSTSMACRARKEWIGVPLSFGNICNSNDRQISSA